MGAWLRFGRFEVIRFQGDFAVSFGFEVRLVGRRLVESCARSVHDPDSGLLRASLRERVGLWSVV